MRYLDQAGGANIRSVSYTHLDVYKRQGYEVLPQTIETYSPQGDVFDVVCLLGTLNHLTEPGEAFEKIAQMMAPSSIFVFDFKDPVVKMARMSQPIGGLQFDHATYPTRRTLCIMLKSAGLGLRAWHTDNQRLYTFIAASDPDAILPETVSYTHLDVYKRQSIHRSLTFSLVFIVTTLSGGTATSKISALNCRIA